MRISVTDRCQMRCRYCLPNGAPPPLPRNEVLTFEEIARITAVGAQLGITRVRLTGGEPLLRRDLHKLVTMINGIAGIESISLTTNGLLLKNALPSLVGAGLTHISISVDSMHRETFEAMTGSNGLQTVLDAVRMAATYENLTVEINTVAIKERTENEILPLIEFSREQKVPVRFIEIMPFEDIEWDERLLLSGHAIEEIIASEHDYEEVERSRAAAPARRFRFKDGQSGFGLIEPVTNPFCSACDRLRMRSDGMLYNCLFGRTGYDLRSAVRSGNDQAIRKVFEESVAGKGPGGMLEFNEQVSNRARIMASIGG